MTLQGKKVLVVGLGKSGVAAATLLFRKGALVTVTDERPWAELTDPLHQLPIGIRIDVDVKKFDPSPFDLIVISPGVRFDHPSLEAARRKKIPVWPELELGWRFVKPHRTVSVTGTNGKTTTTAMIGFILKTAGKRVVVGGNIGTPLSALTRRVDSKTFLVMEVSSYQMEAHQTFHPNVAVLLNLTPDHLARHKTMARYAAAKARMLLHMTRKDTAIYNVTDHWCRAMVSKTKAREIYFPSPALEAVGSLTPLRGEHNKLNAMAAAAAGQALGLKPQEIAKGIRTFRGVRHRIQIVAKKKGVLYVNDSKATNVDSTRVALKSFEEPIILLMGGEHKGSSYKPLRPLISSRVKELIVYGESKNIIAKDLKGAAPLKLFRDLKQAMTRARRAAKKGDVVLLSPACASFDQYKDYEERGDHFISLVKGLPR